MSGDRDPALCARYNASVRAARALEKQGRLSAALATYAEAYAAVPRAVLQAKMDALDAARDARGGCISAGAHTYRVAPRVWRALYAHQRDGVAWLLRLHHALPGGILGDDMGFALCLFAAACAAAIASDL